MSQISPSNFNISNSANTIFGVILNDKKTLDTLAPQLNDAPYKAPAKAPVLYIKPFSTLNTTDTVALPKDTESLELGTTLALVMGKKATRLTADNALEHVSGVALAVDLSIPHDSYYRPAIVEKCFDGSLVLGNKQALPADFSAITLTTKVNDDIVNTRSLADLKRDVATLLVDVTEFMSLSEGDVLLVGVEYQAPQAKAGDKVSVTAEGLGTDGASDELSFTVAKNQSEVVKENVAKEISLTELTGRALIDGKVETVTATADGKAKTADGREFAEDELNWLPPVEIGTVFALGLNYADHAAELAFKAPEKPLVFLKGKNTLVGHNANTRRPANTDYMHYECELAVVIGKQAKNVRAEDAKDYIAGYAVANDYAIRDYLENYYRPNLRVKNRDHCTPIGPWLTPVDKVADPMNLKLITRVNGETTQEGTTSDMIFSVYTLVEYLSNIMTLNAGDVILTGTPEGLADTKHGDVIETEIEGLGILRNTIVNDATYFG